jgi:hypothetical protein
VTKHAASELGFAGTVVAAGAVDMAARDRARFDAVNLLDAS